MSLKLLNNNGYARMPRQRAHHAKVAASYARGQAQFKDLLVKDLGAKSRTVPMNQVVGAESILRLAVGFSDYATQHPGIEVLQVPGEVYSQSHAFPKMAREAVFKVAQGTIDPLLDSQHRTAPVHIDMETFKMKYLPTSIVLYPLELILLSGLILSGSDQALPDLIGSSSLATYDQMIHMLEQGARPLVLPEGIVSESVDGVTNLPAHVATLHDLHHWLVTIQNSTAIQRECGFVVYKAMREMKRSGDALFQHSSFSSAFSQLGDQDFRLSFPDSVPILPQTKLESYQSIRRMFLALRRMFGEYWADQDVLQHLKGHPDYAIIQQAFS